MTGPDDYHDPWRRYEQEPEPEPPRPRRSMGARFLLGLPFVALFWIVAALIRAATP